jgi:hypothetical protein
MNSEVYQRRAGGNVRSCSKHIGLYTALDRCHVVNIDRMVEPWVWPSEAIGRNLHYYPDLASGSLLHKDIIASHVSFFPLDTEWYQQYLDRKLG